MEQGSARSCHQAGRPDLHPRCLMALQGVAPSLPQARRQLAEYILSHSDKVSGMSITDLAREAGTSESTIVKLCRQIGCRGYTDLRLFLAQEAAVKIPDAFAAAESEGLVGLAARVFKQNAIGLEETLRRLDMQQMQRAIDTFAEAGRKNARVHFYGVGSSGLVAAEAAFKLSKLGLTCVYIQDTHNQAMFASLLKPGDVAVGVSRSGRTAETVRALQLAKEAGATTVCITNFTNPPILQYADMALLTACYEDTCFHSEPMTSMISQLAIVQCLFLGLVFVNGDSALAAIRRTQLATADKHL